MSNLERTSNNPDNAKPYKIATGILAALLVLAVVGAVMFSMDNTTLKTETSQLNSTVSDLNVMKASLETELADLENNYDATIDENEELKVTIEEKVEEIEVLQNKIRQVRNRLKGSESNSAKMQEHLAQLESLKDSLEADIVNLQGENEELLLVRDELTVALEDGNNEITGLNEQVVELKQMNQNMTDRLYRMAPAGFKAGNFAVNVARKNDKLTSKAKQAKEIKVNFDLPYVPAEKQGKTELYLVVTDIYGNAIKSASSSTVTVPSPQDDLKVDVVDIETVNLKESQSLAMSFAPEEKLVAGEYHLMVYSDEGYLGATAFRLR